MTETVSMEGETVERSYAYTARNELARVTENGETTVYTYDAAGNRIKEEGPEGTTVYRYDEANRLQSTEGARISVYTWDADGNLIAQKDGDAAYEYLYDTESRLLAVREGGSLLMSVLYDGLDNRAYGLEYKLIDRHLNRFPHLPGYWNNGQWNCIPEEPAGPKNGKQAAQADSAPEETAEEQGLWAAVVEWVSEIFGGENADAEAGIDAQSKEKAAKGKGKNDGYTNNGGADNDHGGNGNTNNGNGKPGNNGNGNGNNGSGNGGGAETAGPISDWARKKLTKLGFTEMDLEMLERLGVTDADARRIVETAKVPNTGNGPTHFIPAYDLMFYVNDINRENVEVLAQGSRYTSDTAYEYGVQRLYADREGERETYLYDGRGSVVQLLQGGTVSQNYSYNAYGYINADAYGVHEPFYGYNGEEHDPFTGLQYLRARYYAPQNGGFITQDSFAGVLTNALSQNRYTYAENDPVNGIDPSGHAMKKTGNTGTSSGSVLKGGSVSGKTSPTSAAKTASPVKKPYTAAPTPPKPAPNYQKSTYSSGAAKAAQSAKTASAPSSPAANTVSSTASQPYLSMSNAIGLINPVNVMVSTFAEAARSMNRGRGCDPAAQHYTAQGDSSESTAWKETSSYYASFVAALGKSSIGRALAFLQGEITAIVDDISSLENNYLGLFKETPQLGGIEDLNEAFTIQSTATYTPLFGNQNEMAAGRIAGHLLVAFFGSLETAASFFGAGVLEGGGMVLAPETGGASVVASTAGAASIVAVFGTQGISIAKEGVAGLFNDPNIQFSMLGNTNKPQKPTIRDLINQISNKNKEKFRCVQFADELERLLRENNISGQRISIQSRTDYIYSDTFGSISENGWHEAIKIGDIVYDNMRPNGIDYAEWIKDLGISDLPELFEITIKPIN